MTACDLLSRLAGGEFLDRGDVLQTGRLTAAGGEAYGEAAIVAAFRQAPLDLSDANWTVGEEAVAALAAEGAVFADLADGRIARLWRIGAPPPAPTGQTIAVPFDPDLAQVRRDVAFDPADFPGLSPDAARIVTDSGRSLARAWRPPAGDGTRAIVIRAFETATEVASLFAIIRAGDGPTPAFGYAIAVTPRSGAASRIAVDPAAAVSVDGRPSA